MVMKRVDQGTLQYQHGMQSNHEATAICASLPQILVGLANQMQPHAIALNMTAREGPNE